MPSHRATVTVTCRQCSREFQTYPAHRNRPLPSLCSRRCIGLSRAIPLADRFWSKVQKTDTCWLWTGATAGKGYGTLGMGGFRGKMEGAHRISYMLHFGEIPEGWEVCHNCPGGDNRKCVNPEHLFLDTQAGNMDDMNRKGRRGRTGPKGSGQLNESAVLVMRYCIKRNLATTGDLARLHHVSRSTAQRAILGYTWKHVPFL